MDVDAKLDELFIDLPEPHGVRDGLLEVVEEGNLVRVVGQLPWSEGRLAYRGRVGLEQTVAQGGQAARLALLQALGTLATHLEGSLNAVKKVESLVVMIASGSDFQQHQQVANGASDLIIDIFGKKGLHGQRVMGVTSLPEGASVQIELSVRTK